MTENDLHEYARDLQRKGMENLQSLYEAFKKAGLETMDFHKGDKYLYIRCDELPPSSIKTIDFLTYCFFLTWRVVAYTRLVDLTVKKEAIPTPFIKIYKA